MCSENKVPYLSYTVLNWASVWAVAKFGLLIYFFFFSMAQQIVTLHGKNGGLSKYSNVISNQMQISAVTVLVIKVSNGMVEHKNEVKVKRLR